MPLYVLCDVLGGFDKLYSPQMVVTSNTTKYTIENDLTKKEKRRKNKQTHRQNGMYLSKKEVFFTSGIFSCIRLVSCALFYKWIS